MQSRRNNDISFLREHASVTRRYFVRSSSLGLVAMNAFSLSAQTDSDTNSELPTAIDQLESWLTHPQEFGDVSRGDPIPHKLDEATRRKVGLTRDTWQLEVISDPKSKTRLRTPLTAEKNTAFTFADLMQLAKTHSVRFPKVMTCLNIGCPLGMGIWEGVPLREVLWLTQPTRDLRRVFYHGYHNDKPEQMFRSSLPVGRILEDMYDLPPVILCYKLNGQWLSPERGGPVRVVVPEAYGFKSIKWLSHVFLSNQWAANDTYGDQNNDVDSPLKTFCDTLSVPDQVKPMQGIPITGYAQVGVSGLQKVQVWLHDEASPLPKGEKYFSNAPWRDATILPPPKAWGGGLLDDKIPERTIGFDSQTGSPLSWPLPLAKVHWATLLPGVPAGEYTLRCRTIDGKGHAQPMPRPFQKSGHAAISRTEIRVEA